MKKRSTVLLVGAGLVLGAVVLWLLSRDGSDLAASGSDSSEPAGAGPSLPVAAERTAVPGRPVVEPLTSPPSVQARKRFGRLERAPSGGVRGVIERALANNSRPELALMDDLARAGVPSPPVVGELFERQRRGASSEELRAFVRARFPKQLKLRLLTMRWINRLDPARVGLDQRLSRPSGKPLPPLGSIERVSPGQPTQR